ncbi:MAG: NAD+ synthase [Actinomycetota bacterium]|nr:NAD+ synthase [Actinomycetota bacterium]
MALRIALAQINPLVGDVIGNTDLVLTSWRRAADSGADLVVFPELVVTGYPPEDLLLKPEFVAANLEAVERAATEGPQGTAAVVGFVARDGRATDAREWDVTVSARDDLHDSAAVIADGEVIGIYHKGRLPTYGVFDEARWFTAGYQPLVVKVAGVAVGVVICEDIWNGEGPLTTAARHGARVGVVLNASPYHRGKRDQRERWVRHHARQDGIWVAYVNAVGGQDGLVFDGDSFVSAPDGVVVARAVQFDEDLLVVDLEVGVGERSWLAQDRGRDRLVDDEPRPDAVNPRGRVGQRPELPDRPQRPRLDPVAEVWEALVLGTRDYCRKNGFERAVIGLSGGIDSSLTAAIAVDALGADNVLGVLMPSPHTSEQSRDDAEAVAKNLDISTDRIEITALMEGFADALADLFAGRERDETEENIQARIRGVLLMAISNKLGPIVLATGNKSETAVGYATLYGDMVGGFAPLVDVHKLLVYDLARHRNERGEVIPESVLTKPPTAELRPGQRDEDALPPYEVLDPIMCSYVEDDLGVDAIVERGYDRDTVRQVVGMIDHVEYKRRQAALGVRITQRAFGRDRHVPVTNGWKG